MLTIQEALQQKQKEKENVKGEAREGLKEETPESEAKSKTTRITGEFEIGPQYHFHMETQICICKPKEGGMDVISSTQWMDFVQEAIAGALGLPQNA